MNEKRCSGSICIIGVYFGILPEWFQLWILSVKYNPTIDFLIVTDQSINTDLKNLRIINMDLKSFRKLARKKLKTCVRIDTPYKLCDFKEVYGIIMEDEIVQYDYWGECDFDVVFGDLRYFFEKYEYTKYDKFLNRGHLSLYRNTPEVNKRYKLSGGEKGSYREVFRSDLNWAFDETTGINKIYEKHGFSFFNEFICADIDIHYKDIRMVERPGDYCVNHEKQIFSWNHGKVIKEWVEDNKLFEKQYPYIHLQKRKMNKPAFDVNTVRSFYICPNDFVEKKENTSLKMIERLNPRNNTVINKFTSRKYTKVMQNYWVGRRFLNARHEVWNCVKKYIG